MQLIDVLVKSPGRWILILDSGHPGGRYVQLLLYEDGSIVAEASSNNFLEGSRPPECRGGWGTCRHRLERAPPAQEAKLVVDTGHYRP